MRAYISLFLLLVIFGLNAGTAAAGSDYDLIVDFKKSHATLESELLAADSMEKCNVLEGKIAQLKTNYEQHKTLFDQGIYPNTFDSWSASLNEHLNEARTRVATASKLEEEKQQVKTISSKLVATEQDLATSKEQMVELNKRVEGLVVQIGELNSSIAQLTKENENLVAQIRTMSDQEKKDKKVIAEQKQLLEKLKEDVKKRDDMVLNMMGQLFKGVDRPSTETNRKLISLSVGTDKYVNTILETILDHRRFLNQDVALSEAELRQSAEDYKKFADLWQNITPTLGELYANSKEKETSFTAVEGALSGWKVDIDNRIWSELNALLRNNNVGVTPFKNGPEFFNNLKTYLDDKLVTSSNNDYPVFRDQVWTVLDGKLLPFLVTNGNLTVSQQSELTNRVAQWGESYSKARKLKIAGALAILIVLVGSSLMFLRWKRRRSLKLQR